MVRVRVATTLAKSWEEHIRTAIYAKATGLLLPHARGSIRNSVKAWATNAFAALAEVDPGNAVVTEHQCKESQEAAQKAEVLAVDAEVRKENEESHLPRNLLEERRAREERIKKDVESSMAAAHRARMEALQNEAQKAAALIKEQEELALKSEAEGNPKREEEQATAAAREAGIGEEQPALKVPRIETMAEAQTALASGKISAVEFAQLFVEANGDDLQADCEKRIAAKRPAKKVTFNPFPPKSSATYSRDEYDRAGSSEYLSSRLTEQHDGPGQSEGYMLSCKEQMEAEVEEEILMETARGEGAEAQESQDVEGEEPPNSPGGAARVLGKLGSFFD